ncbi:DUF115 domain-containing protein [Alteromonas aestuariivivens]|uniref:DUF115 domain-containing protein n=1 Tax=Alteromonas aestuariivivens TaxID=1938339 RepID=A0A3D8M789_9ALTE|nr:6-hydroxymethylpterin diphosphokinase MptE-like protein [Alteromonas aestuariivivens]RDV25042.1 DUF115 domain-containing protein [Alteromonas aestuariivivens]
MLQNIQLHLHLDETTQRGIEQGVAERLSRMERDNLAAFRQNIPSVLSQIGGQNESWSIMCNKHSELNIVDYSTGRVLYGLHPEQEVAAQVRQFAAAPLTVALDDTRTDTATRVHNFLEGLNSSLASSLRRSKPLEDQMNVLVVLGVGLGHHIRQLLEQYQIGHMIVYEPNLDYFRCSLMATAWNECLDIAAQKGTGLYLQLGKDARDLASNINELAQHVPVEQFYLFQHYHHIVFDQVTQALAAGSWQDFKHWAVRESGDGKIENYLLPWSVPVDAQAWSTENLKNYRLKANLAVFKKFFPGVYQEFCDYQPKIWVPLANQDGQVNLFHCDSLLNLYTDAPREDGERVLEAFAARPNKDSLVLGYKGKKLKSYLHYQMVSKVQDILDEIEETQGALSERIKSMIMFGLGSGYQLEALFAKHTVEKLFVVEPNRDYFYASLYAIDWQAIIEGMDKAGARLYLNIGDDGSHLIEDLVMQFHSIGPHVLASTYFFQGYYNGRLNSAIAQLREQLRVIIAMGDYFDHSRYGIAHTHWSLLQGTPYLRKDASQYLSAEEKEVPVFLIGNGPSLDGLLAVIKEHAEQAILVSCGTALQVLHRHGIVPDFHAEIEINRSTFDWAVRIGDLDYLKNIRLISCNGIHPDTSGLYKETLLAFKEGESSTVSITDMFEGHDFEMLSHAYPTVSNFAANFVTRFGFKQIYLCGVDMGFVDNKYHHSKASGYYNESGEEAYNYAEMNDTSIVVPGNFRPFVNTKYEFKVSKTVLEQVLTRVQGEVYNLNDGARITGAQPLHGEHVLIVNSPEDKQAALDRLINQGFAILPVDEYQNRFERRVQHSALVEELNAFATVIEQPVTSRDDAEVLIERQREFLVSSYRRKRSLAFYYLNGTINYVNGALTKALHIKSDSQAIQIVQVVLDNWIDCFKQLTESLTVEPYSFDYISSFDSQRRRLYLKLCLESKDPLIGGVYPDEAFNRRYLSDALSVLGIQKEISLADQPDLDYQICFGELSNDDINHKVLISGQSEILDSFLSGNIQHTLLYLPGDMNNSGSPVCNDVARAFIARLVATSPVSPSIVLPKLIVKSVREVANYYNLEKFEKFYAYDCINFLIITHEPLDNNLMFFDDGTRARLIPRRLRAQDLISLHVSESEFEELREFRLQKFTSLTVGK